MFRISRVARLAAANGTHSAILNYPYKMVESESELRRVTDVLSRAPMVSMDIEAFCHNNPEQKHLGDISLIQLCSAVEPAVFMVDVVTLGKPLVSDVLKPLMASATVKKYMFDCRRDVEALSFQLRLKPAAVVDLQLLHTAMQWRLRGVNRRSSMSYVLKQTLGIERQAGDSAVHQAMTVGNRPVWDVRPLPPHFLEYAADDVRHILLLADAMAKSESELVDKVERLSALYVDHYSIGKPVEVEADPKSNQVVDEWLERFLGPAGKCAFCGQKGHTEAECFKKGTGVIKCAHCGQQGHTAKNCFKKHPHLLKCTHCGQMGHTVEKCFVKSPCGHCGGPHATESCHKMIAKERAQQQQQQQRARDGRGASTSTSPPSST